MGRGLGGCATRIGALDDNLGLAIKVALGASSRACVEEGQRYDWERCTDQFLAGLRPVRATAGPDRRKIPA
jgi:hypothetical protein